MKYFSYLTLAITFLSCNSSTNNNGEHQEIIESDIPDFKHLNAINIQVDSIIPWDIKTSCELTFSNSFSIVDGKIKCRGGISSKYWKHSFSLSLNSDTSLIEGIDPDDDYIVNANYIDKSFLRHKLSYDLFRKINPDNLAPRCAFKHIFINQSYEGLYVMMEEVDKSFVGFHNNDSNVILIKDGGLFIKDHTDFYIQPGEDLFQQKYPKNQTESEFEELRVLWEFLFNSSDQEFLASVGNKFDLENVRNWHLLLLIANNGDGVLKNFYWYKGNDQIWRVIPWDYDDSFGRNGDGTMQMSESGWERNILLKRLFELNVDGYQQKLADLWYSLSSKNLSLDSIHTMIDSDVSKLNQIGVKWNFKKWPINDSNYIDSNTFEQEIDLLHNYFDERFIKIDSLFNAWGTL